MPITDALCNSWKKEILEGVHRAGDKYMIALYTREASLGKTTRTYSSKDEVPESVDGETTGYTQGGLVLTGQATALSGDTAFIDWADPSWPYASITARGYMIYNASRGNKAVAVYEFKDVNGIGMDVTSSNGPFTIKLPPPGSSAIVRLS